MKKKTYNLLLLLFITISLTSHLESAKNLMEIDDTLQVQEQPTAPVAHQPFDDGEAKSEYNRLAKKEKELIQYNAPENAWDLHRAELNFFYGRLFATVIKKNIAQEKEYTKSLGLAYDPTTKKLTMVLKPMCSMQALKHRLLLCDLALHQKDQKTLWKMHDFLCERINQSMDTNSLFPTIRLLETDSSELENFAFACYDVKANEIIIRKKDFLLASCNSLLHEFAHRLQWLQGSEMGGVSGRPFYCHPAGNLDFIHSERDAELQQIYNHPVPEAYAADLYLKCIKLLSNRSSILNTGSKKKIVDKYPYLTAPEEYINICKEYKINIPTKIAQSIKKFTGKVSAFHTKLEYGNMHTITDAPNYKILYRENIIAHNYLKQTLTTHAQQQSMPSDSITLAVTEPLTGSKRLFELKNKLGLIPATK